MRLSHCTSIVLTRAFLKSGKHDYIVCGSGGMRSPVIDLETNYNGVDLKTCHVVSGEHKLQPSLSISSENIAII